MATPAEEATRMEAPDLFPESLGDWCLRKGLVAARDIEACLKVQKSLERGGLRAPRLGEILVQRGLLSPSQVAEALRAQRVGIRFCPRCLIRVNVPLREDVDEYRCGRCQRLLCEDEGDERLDVIEEPSIVVSRGAVPEEVVRAERLPQNRFGKYVLLGELGKGGVGVVNKAWDTYLKQPVALKRLRMGMPGEAPEMVEFRSRSLLSEARNAIRLRHPGIVSLFDVGRVGEEYYISMEYLEGDTLQGLCAAARREGKPSWYHVDPRRALRIVAEVARAAHYAHSRPAPIVHCDLKPANILVDREGHAHILDFGLARDLAAQAGDSGEVSGTPSYMAPEQASGRSERIDARTDVYGVGAILYELLVGRPPFVGEPLEVIRQTIQDRPERPTARIRRERPRASKEGISTDKLLRIPAFLEELCMRCLEKDMTLRPSSLLEVAEALEKAARPGGAGPAEPVTVASPAASARPLGFRNWLPALAALLGTTPCGMGGALRSWGRPR